MHHFPSLLLHVIYAQNISFEINVKHKPGASAPRAASLAELADPGGFLRAPAGPISWNCFGHSKLNDGRRASHFEECCHAPSHTSGRKPLQTLRFDWRRQPPLVN
jgi:hypothetical protein